MPDKTINVLHITFDMTLGGTQQVIRQLVSYVDQSKVRSTIVCIDGTKGELGEICEQKGVASIELLQRQAGLDMNLVKSLKQLIIKHQIDIVHCHQYSPYFYGLLAGILTQKKVVFTEHGRFYPDVPKFKRKLINPVFSLFTKAITAISKATADALVNIENFPKNKVSVIYNGVADARSLVDIEQTQHFKGKHKIDDDTFVFGTISRLEPIKNQPLMIKAFADIVRCGANVKLLVIGDGAMRDELAQLVVELGISEQVIFTGFVVEPQKYLELMDVFLLPSFSEGTSMTLLEAMSFSTPAIVTNVGGSPEIVLDGVTGTVIKNDNLEQLIEAMTNLMTNESLVEQYGSAALSRYRELFTESAMAKQYQQLYQNII